MLVALATAARAAVAVEDPSGCLRAPDLAAALDDQLGPASARLVVQVRVLADGPLRATELRVAVGREVWERDLALQAVDCPFAAGLVARSVAQGLEALPGWDVTPPRWSWAPRAEIGGLVGTGPAQPGLKLGLAGVARAEAWRAPLGARLEVATPAAVGGGLARTSQAVAEAGLRAGAGGWEGGLGLGLGLAWVVGTGFQENKQRLVPRLPLRAELRVGQALAGALSVETPLLRLEWAEAGSGARTLEAPLRVGLALSWEGRPASRPSGDSWARSSSPSE